MEGWNWLSTYESEEEASIESIASRAKLKVKLEVILNALQKRLMRRRERDISRRRNGFGSDLRLEPAAKHRTEPQPAAPVRRQSPRVADEKIFQMWRWGCRPRNC